MARTKHQKEQREAKKREKKIREMFELFNSSVEKAQKTDCPEKLARIVKGVNEFVDDNWEIVYSVGVDESMSYNPENNPLLSLLDLLDEKVILPEKDRLWLPSSWEAC